MQPRGTEPDKLNDSLQEQPISVTVFFFIFFGLTNLMTLLSREAECYALSEATSRGSQADRTTHAVNGNESQTIYIAIRNTQVLHEKLDTYRQEQSTSFIFKKERCFCRHHIHKVKQMIHPNRLPIQLTE